MLTRLKRFLKQFNILDDAQHGFRNGRSTTTASFQFTEKIYEAFDNRDGCAGLFIDLSKAVDLVNFGFLLSKLHDIGIRGIANVGSDLISLQGSNVSILHQIPIQEFPLLRKSTKVFHKVPSLVLYYILNIYINDIAFNFPEYHDTGYADDTKPTYSL
jgi:hypothetical protein